MSYKVLVVDDEPRIHTFIRISLSAEGFDYIGASTIAEAKACFEAHSPHVILLDLGLPDGDGKEFLTTLRQTYKTPVLVLTARDQEEEKIRRWCLFGFLCRSDLLLMSNTSVLLYLQRCTTKY